MSGLLLEVKNLTAVFKTHTGTVHALNGASFDAGYGEILGVVGESGCGKSAAMLSVMKLLPGNGRVTGGDIVFDGRSIRDHTPEMMRKIRGKEIGMIFQDPMTSLNPVFSIGYQMVETAVRHMRMSKAEAAGVSAEMLDTVGISDPVRRMKQYPHEFSGGMRQRVMIAMALLCRPKLLIADEPTTALDVTIQAQILELIREIRYRSGMSVILITHDLGLVAGICDRAAVMYAGSVVEQGKVEDIFNKPLHPYTAGLLRCIQGTSEAARGANVIPGTNAAAGADGSGKMRLKPINGQPPDMTVVPEGCPFVLRCPEAMEICRCRKPEYTDTGVSSGASPGTSQGASPGASPGTSPGTSPAASHGAACWLLCKKAAQVGEAASCLK